MSDDIVTRLRIPLPYNLQGMTTTQLGAERREAADEIGRLRAENHGLRIRILTLIDKIESLAVRGE